MGGPGSLRNKNKFFFQILQDAQIRIIKRQHQHFNHHTGTQSTTSYHTFNQYTHKKTTKYVTYQTVPSYTPSTTPTSSSPPYLVPSSSTIVFSTATTLSSSPSLASSPTSITTSIVPSLPVTNHYSLLDPDTPTSTPSTTNLAVPPTPTPYSYTNQTSL